MKKYIKNLSKQIDFDNILIIISILVSKSLYYESYGENILLLFLFLLLLISVMYKSKKKKFNIHRITLIFFFIFLAIIFINPNLKISTSLVFIACLTISLLFTNSIPLTKFTDVFYNLTKFLMIASLFRYVILFINVPSILPDFVNIIGENYNNFIFFGVRDTSVNLVSKFSLIRNNGLWWEPGSFQVIINLAFMLGLVFNKVSIRDYLTFLVVLLTTFSTAGIIIFILLSILYFHDMKYYKYLLSILLILSPLFASNAYYDTVIVDKLSLDNGSAYSRFSDLTLDLRIFLDNPLFGIGMGNLETLESYKVNYSYGTGSNGILYLLRNVGLMSIFFFIPLLFPSYIKNYSMLWKLIIPLSLFLIFFTQNFTIILIFSIVIFYGIRTTIR